MFLSYFDIVLWKMQRSKDVQVFGRLVLLGYVISDFTPTAYQRHRL